MKLQDLSRFETIKLTTLLAKEYIVIISSKYPHKLHHVCGEQFYEKIRYFHLRAGSSS